MQQDFLSYLIVQHAIELIHIIRLLERVSKILPLFFVKGKYDIWIRRFHNQSKFAIWKCAKEKLVPITFCYIQKIEELILRKCQYKTLLPYIIGLALMTNTDMGIPPLA